MKKVFGLILVSAFALAFVACGNKAKEEAAAKRKADSTVTADSIARADAEMAAVTAKAKAKADSTVKADSIAAAMPKKKKK